MIEDGLFEQFPMDSVWGMHNWPGMSEGSVAVHKDLLWQRDKLKLL